MSSGVVAAIERAIATLYNCNSKPKILYSKLEMFIYIYILIEFEKKPKHQNYQQQKYPLSVYLKNYTVIK